MHLFSPPGEALADPSRSWGIYPVLLECETTKLRVSLGQVFLRRHREKARSELNRILIKINLIKVYSINIFPVKRQNTYRNVQEILIGKKNEATESYKVSTPLICATLGPVSKPTTVPSVQSLIRSS